MNCQQESDKIKKKIKTHFGWRNTLYSFCFHCNRDSVVGAWHKVWKIQCGKRTYSLFSCPRCGGLDVEVMNLRTATSIAKSLTKEEAEKLYVILKI